MMYGKDERTLIKCSSSLKNRCDLRTLQGYRRVNSKKQALRGLKKTIDDM
jgi:hypothetical protein